jgi:hypothetical protein
MYYKRLKQYIEKREKIEKQQRNQGGGGSQPSSNHHQGH